MPICPKCHSVLDEFKGKFVCSNEGCDFALSKAKFLQRYPSEVQHDFPQELWFKQLCADETLWQKNVFEDYPCIIAHEYWRLYDLLDQGQTYGAFLQLKDVFEVLIKFPTLIAASMLYGKRERSDEENKILIALLEKWLTLGTWEEIAKTMGKKITLPQNVAAIQNDIVRFFHEYSIREWRNKAIGHGALAFDADKEFQQDIQEKLLLLKTHFQDYAGAYATLCVFLQNHEQRVLLHGKEKARNLPYQASEIRIKIGEVFEHPLSPYILLKNSRIYFFDSYIPHDQKTVILNYPEGDKQQVYNDDFTRLYTTLAMDHRLKQLSGSLANETYSTLEAETLDKIAAIDDFQKPVYLRTWLKELVDRQTKGVFLLQMERGMGKTTFARALDQQAMSRIHLNDPDDFSVRSYYINSAYLYKVEHFTSKAGFLLLTDINRKIAIQGNLPVLSGRSEHKPQDFAGLLTFYRREHQRHFRKARLLFIIDGLDEIPATDGVSIFDFLPTPELLDDGVFLLLTCRTDPEISPFTRHHLNTVTFTDYLSVQKDDLRHVDVLRAYINNQIASTERQHVEILLKKAENRFLYLKTIKVLLKVSQHPEELVFSDGKALFTEFLDTLRHAYGEKFFTGVVKLLAILATAFEPLTLHEISYLTGEAQPTFKLLAHLIDLRGFLNAEHSYRGNVLAIAHPDLRQVMHEHYDHSIQALVQRWIEEHLSEDVQDVDIEEDGKIYLLTYMVDYVKTYTEKSYDSVFDAAFVEKLSTLALKLQRDSQAEHHRERVIALYTVVVEMQTQLLKTGALPDEQVFTKTFMNRGRAYLNMHRIEDAIADYDRVIAIRQRLLDTGKSEEKDPLAAALVNRGTAYLLLQNAERAISDYGQAIELRQYLQKQGTLQDESSLARIFVNRGNVHRRIHNIHAAIVDFSHAVEIQQRCFKGGILEHEHELAAALMNRGIAYMQIHNNRNALADYDRAIELFQQLRHSGRLTNETHIARALINRAILYGRKQQLSQAIADYTQAIESQEKLHHTGRLVDANELARTYVNRGIIYKTKHQYQEAIADYQRAIEIQENLLHEGKLRYENELAWALVHRGEAYTQDQQIEQALADFERALLIQQELLQAGKFVDERELALTYLNRGIAFTKKGQFPEAISDFDHALTKQQELLQAGKLSDEDELAWTLLHRGIVYRENQQFTEALADFDHAIAIQQQLKASGELLDEHDLVLAFLHRGTTHNARQNVSAALDDMRTALDIIRALLPARPFLLETYKQTLSSLMSILQEHGMTALLPKGDFRCTYTRSKNRMSTRQNVLDALQHKQPAKIPYDIQFTKNARQKMIEFYGDPDFESRLGNCLTVVRSYRFREIQANIWEDPFGVHWDRTLDKDIGVVINRLITPETFDEYSFPDPGDPAIYARYAEGATQKHVGLVTVKMGYNLFERAWSLVGMENLLMYMITHKPFVHALLDRILEYNLRVIENFCQFDVDAVFLGDDWGQQTGLLMGPKLWREFIKPRIREMYQLAKSKGKFVLIHCCGKVQELFPDLIECGLDVFNPFQPEVMDVFEMKKTFGDRLSFYGGISTQQTLPFGSVQETRDEVNSLLEVVGKNGGYIASPAHAIPGDAKPENIAAMIEVLQNQ